MGPFESPLVLKSHDSQDMWRETRCILLHFKDFTKITVFPNFSDVWLSSR